MKREITNFTPHEISVLINNAFAVAQRPMSGDISERRIRRCREVAQAMIEPLQEMILGGIDEETGEHFKACLRKEELVAILLASALFVQMALNVEGEGLPQARISDMLFKKVM